MRRRPTMEKSEFFGIYKQMFVENGLERYTSEEVMEKFFLLAQIMRETNEKMNITAITEEREIIARHYIDCLFAAELLPAGANVLDVGSGGGMPTLPFAIVRPDVTVTALDATAKKTAYIADTAAKLGLSNVKIATGRAEELGRDGAYREKYDVVCARAVAALNILLEWCVPFAKKGGLFIAMKGKNAEEELKTAQNAVKKLGISLAQRQNITLHEENGTSTRENFIFIKNEKKAMLYPRANAQIKKKPL